MEPKTFYSQDCMEVFSEIIGETLQSINMAANLSWFGPPWAGNYYLCSASVPHPM